MPVLALVYLIDASLAPIGFLAVLASEVHQHAYLLAIGVGPTHVLSVARAGGAFSPVERDLLEHLAAQGAVSLENLRLEALMRRTSAELHAILEGVADAVAAEDPDGRLVYVNAAAARRGGRARLAARRPRRAPPRPAGVQGNSRTRCPKSRGSSPPRSPTTARSTCARTASCACWASAAAASSRRPPWKRCSRAARRGCGWSPGSRPRSPCRSSSRDGTAGTITLHNAQFTEADVALAEDLGLRVGSAVDNARLYHARAMIAHTLQQSLLPPELPEIPGLETAAHFRPAGEGIEVGGDFYDLFATGEREWFAVMGDVCGKGATAAAVTAMVRYTIRAAVMRNRSPAGILRWLNAAMLRQRAGRFVTIAITRLELEPGGTVAVTVASGGHPLPRILRSTGSVEELGTTGTLLGVLPDVELEDRGALLAAGNALVLYTDGLTEVTAPRVWSAAHLDAAIAGARQSSAQGIVEQLAARADAEREGPPRDDLALLALRVL